MPHQRRCPRIVARGAGRRRLGALRIRAGGDGRRRGTLDDEGRGLAVAGDRTGSCRSWRPICRTHGCGDAPVLGRCGAALERLDSPTRSPAPGYLSAFARTFGPHDLSSALRPSSALETAAPTTLFICANQLATLPPIGASLEVACHGDIHVPFDNPRTNEARHHSGASSRVIAPGAFRRRILPTPRPAPPWRSASFSPYGLQRWRCSSFRTFADGGSSPACLSTPTTPESSAAGALPSHERALSHVVAQQRLPRHLVLPPGALSGCQSSVPASY